MTIIKTSARLNRKIRHCNRVIKNAKNDAKALHDEATYHQAVIDNIFQRSES